MTPTPFEVYLNPEAVQRLGRTTNRITLDFEGVEVLRDELADMEISLADDVVSVVPVKDRQLVDAHIKNALHLLPFDSITLASENGVYLMAELKDGGIVEYNITNSPDDLSTFFMLTTYWFEEGYRLFKEEVNKTYIDAEFVVVEIVPDLQEESFLQMIYSQVVMAITKNANDGSMVTSRLGEEFLATFDISPQRNIRGQQIRVGWFEASQEDGCLFRQGEKYEEHTRPEQCNDFTDILDLAIATIIGLENVIVRDLSSDGDNTSCEVIFYVEGQGYIKVSSS